MSVIIQLRYVICKVVALQQSRWDDTREAAQHSIAPLASIPAPSPFSFCNKAKAKHVKAQFAAC